MGKKVVYRRTVMEMVWKAKQNKEEVKKEKVKCKQNWMNRSRSKI